MSDHDALLVAMECYQRSTARWRLADEREDQARALPFWKRHDRRVLLKEAARLRATSDDLLRNVSRIATGH